mmetsp:Transcript_8529/g.26533  ORF Transcript_8529/g.26533 Transcript_8529/m.26533 type:complete len:141 (-) Transcript_8529:58-480(-)
MVAVRGRAIACMPERRFERPCAAAGIVPGGPAQQQADEKRASTGGEARLLKRSSAQVRSVLPTAGGRAPVSRGIFAWLAVHLGALALKVRSPRGRSGFGRALLPLFLPQSLTGQVSTDCPAKSGHVYRQAATLGGSFECM